VTVTQEAGEITKLVLQPLTQIVAVPQLPELWAPREGGYLNQNNLPEARRLLEELGIKVSG
jgi:hypothetical protein